MAAYGSVIAEDFVFDDRLAGADCVVEIGLVVGGVAVVWRIGVGLTFEVKFPIEWRRVRVLVVPLLQVLIAERRRPAENGIAFRLRTGVLRLVGEGGVFDDHGALGAK